MIFLHSHGVGTARAVRIFKTYGADAIQIMIENTPLPITLPAQTCWWGVGHQSSRSNCLLRRSIYDWYSCAVGERDAIDQGRGCLPFSWSTLFIMVTKTGASTTACSCAPGARIRAPQRRRAIAALAITSRQLLTLASELTDRAILTGAPRLLGSNRPADVLPRLARHGVHLDRSTLPCRVCGR
jgi:hypothetical protein